MEKELRQPNEPNIKINEVRVDFIGMIRNLVRKWFYVLLTGLDFGLAVVLLVMLFVPDKYVSDTKIFILNRENTSTVLYSDVEISTQLTNDYREVVTSRTVLEKVISQLQLSMTTEELADKITVEVPYNTRMLYIYVRMTEPKLAYETANCLTKIIADRMEQVMDIEAVNIIDFASVPMTASSPNYKLYFLYAAFFGAAAAITVLCAGFLLDDRIKTAEDLEELLEISILGTIPMMGHGGVRKERGKRLWKGSK